ncbi:hypothetical protein [Planctomonas deserti]|uniref:hypothetical protein n=1 Tax=Planctomonas deserti TaxID=2144185 RepID=UPI00131EEA89|nr:hypothetical protein [Planctomonas deserti]
MGKKSFASVVLSALALVTVTGCSPTTPEPTVTPTRSASAEPSPTAGSTAEPTDETATPGAPSASPSGAPSSAPTPGEPSASTPAPTSSDGGAEAEAPGTPLTAQEVYLACQREGWQAAASSPEELSWTPFESAYVVQAGDAWRAYIEYVRTPSDGSAVFEGAVSCVFRGSVENPVAERVGAGLRDDPTSEAYWAPEGE